MKWLAGLMSGLGLAVGFGFAVATRHTRSGAVGWTSYVALNQTGHVDYFPKRGASWLPVLAVYPLVGALAGLVIALLLARLGFRLTRSSSRGDISAP